MLFRKSDPESRNRLKMKNSFRLCAFADEADASLDGQIRALKRNGISLLEIRGIGKKSIIDITPSEAKEIRARLDAEGIRVWSLGSPIGKIRLTDPMAPHLDALKRLLECGNLLGAENLRMFSFYLPAGVSPEDCRDEVIERVSRMAELSRGSGIAPCHENEKGIFGDIAPRCADLLACVKELEAVFDPANFIQCRQPTLPAWELLSPRVHYLHIKDALPDGSVVPAGQGDGHLAQLLAAYAGQGGSVVTLEPHLFSFIGLQALEQDAKAKSAVGGLHFTTPDEAFDAAVAALRTVIETL